MSRPAPLLFVGSFVLLLLGVPSQAMGQGGNYLTQPLLGLAGRLGLAQRSLSPEEARQALARAESQRRIGELEAAVTVLEPLVGHPDEAIAAEAAYKLGLTRTELGLQAEAASTLQDIARRFPSSPLAERSTFLLGFTLAQAGDCPGAIQAFERYLSRAGPLSQHASYQMSSCYQKLGDGSAAVARAEQALQPGSPRLLRIEALERQAEVLEHAGDSSGSLNRYQQLIELARDRHYKADMGLRAARLSGELGDDRAAAAQLVAIVSELPNARGAQTALDRLVELQAQDLVSFFDAGMVRFYGGNYAAAIRNFDGVGLAPGEVEYRAGAAYYRAVSRVRLGEEISGAQDLLALPGSFPSSRYAPDGLLRGAKVLESNGRLVEAGRAYQRVANDYPASSHAKEGLLRLGLVHLLRGAPGEANAAWARLGSSDASPDLRALGLLWQGKMEARQGNQSAARATWQGAADLAPTWYGGARARALLEGRPDPRPESPSTVDPGKARLQLPELAELETWASQRGAGLQALAVERASDQAAVRAEELLAMGRKAEAGWELDELAGRYSTDPARLAGLAVMLHERGFDELALTYAQRTLDAAKITSREAPQALQKLLYPLPYAELFTAQASKRGLDPLLFASLVRQESLFQPTARSVADARGLSQVMPETGRGISRALGRPEYSVEELYKPAINLEFGAFYLAERLNRFGGSLFPALAAYNAGDGAVDRWISEYGLEDPDLFAERIPYAETNHYVKVVFENYGLYRALYANR